MQPSAGLFGGLLPQGFRLPVDPESQMTVFSVNSKTKDIFEVQEAAGDVLPFLVVNRFDVAPVVLRFLDGSVRIKR